MVITCSTANGPRPRFSTNGHGLWRVLICSSKRENLPSVGFVLAVLAVVISKISSSLPRRSRKSDYPPIGMRGNAAGTGRQRRVGQNTRGAAKPYSND